MSSPLVLNYTFPGAGFTLTLPISVFTTISVSWGGAGTANSDTSFTYTNSGSYTVSISGTGINTFSYQSVTGTGARYLTGCASFGDIGLTKINFAKLTVSDTSVLTSVPTTLPSSIIDLSYMFYGAGNFDQDISGWDVTNVTNMSYMFDTAGLFNNAGNPLSWGSKTSGVTNMSYMFHFAPTFNQDVSGWNVSNVTDMSYMFEAAFNFDNRGNSLLWGSKTAKVVNMRNMFSSTREFKKDISGWDVSSVTNMSGMFSNTYVFNNGGNALSWGSKTANVINMSGMFSSARLFNQDISSWNVSSVTNMSYMFSSARLFNQNISSWNVSSVTNMSNMFSGALVFNNGGLALSWGSTTQNVTNMNNMFYNAPVFNQDISGWNVSSVTNMSYMFYVASVFNQDVSGWNTGGVTNMSGMFSDAASFNQNVSGWNTINVTNMSNMFYNALAFNKNIGAWNFSKVTDITSILDYSGLTVATYNATLNSIASSLYTLPSTLNFQGHSLVYSPSGLTSHNYLSGTKGWIFNGDAYISSNTITKNIPFSFTVNAVDGYQAGNYKFPYQVTPLSGYPVQQTYNFAGVPGTIPFTNLVFTTTGNNFPVILYNNILGKNTYYLSVTDTSNVPCFKEGTKILTDNGYVFIQDLRNGDMVKTLKDGYKPIAMIGSRELIHFECSDRIKTQLYKCERSEYPELLEDLVITGSHSVLVDGFKDGEREKTIDVLGNIYVTDGKYRLPVCVDEKASIYETPGTYTIYHIALENENYFGNYGIYANGLLVETCSKRYLKELSEMILIE